MLKNHLALNVGVFLVFDLEFAVSKFGYQSWVLSMYVIQSLAPASTEGSLQRKVTDRKAIYFFNLYK